LPEPPGPSLDPVPLLLTSLPLSDPLEGGEGLAGAGGVDVIGAGGGVGAGFVESGFVSGPGFAFGPGVGFAFGPGVGTSPAGEVLVTLVTATAGCGATLTSPAAAERTGEGANVEGL
jgi:hypothetical protein